MKSKDIKYRLTGISVGTVGASWEKIKTERDKAQGVITFLEDRRVLYTPYDFEVPHHCIESVLEIRKFLTAQLQDLDVRTKLAKHLRAMRASCRKFLDALPKGHSPSQVFMTALGELRGVLGIHLAIIAAHYGLDVEDNLASIFPVADEEE
jgi:hypothetical protein